MNKHKITLGSLEDRYTLTGKLALYGITLAEACFWRVLVDHCPPSSSEMPFQPHGMAFQPHGMSFSAPQYAFSPP